MTALHEVTVPDIGDFADVEVIELLVKPGDEVHVEDSLITLESDKAAMEVPSPFSGTVTDLKIAVGDRVSKGSQILTLNVAEDVREKPQPENRSDVKEIAVAPAEPAQADNTEAKDHQTANAETSLKKPPLQEVPAGPTSKKPHASPSVRRFARELGAEVDRIKGTGPKGRILKEDVQAFVKGRLQRAGTSPWSSLDLAEGRPDIDYSAFGAIETVSLSRIKKLSGPNLHRSWVTVPHVTQHDHADITDLEAFRKSIKGEAEQQGVKLTFLPFLMKAVVAGLQAFPNFNASLGADGEHLILKKYYHIGVAVDTPEGLLVPVVRDVDDKGSFELAVELSDISNRAREKKLRLPELQGGSFSISSLGGIGGNLFTPIVNTPEVAILGVSRASMQPVYQGDQLVPRLMLPLSLSYDHRVVDGADAARFIVELGKNLNDVRRLLL